MYLAGGALDMLGKHQFPEIRLFYIFTVNLISISGHLVFPGLS